MAQPIVGRRLKRIKRLFPNHLVRHLLLRLVARHFPRAKLAVELEDYLAHTPATENLEVAGYAALAGLPTERHGESSIIRSSARIWIPDGGPMISGPRCSGLRRAHRGGHVALTPHHPRNPVTNSHSVANQRHARNWSTGWGSRLIPFAAHLSNSAPRTRISMGKTL
jgi:hypothetical protein